MEVQVKQFKDKDGNYIAGKTPEHAVYDTDGVRLDSKLKEMNENIYPRVVMSEDELNAIIEDSSAIANLKEGYDYLAYEDNE